MSSVVLEIVKTVGIESAVFGIGNLAQSFSSGDNIVSLAIGVGDLSAGCKFTATTYGMIIGIYRAVS